MKKLIATIFAIALSLGTFAQHPVFVSPRIDTTNVRNREILELWQDYRQKLFENSFRGQTHDLTVYWAESELKYEAFDFYRARFFNLDLLYTYFPTFALKIDSVGTDIFSLQVMTMRRFTQTCDVFFPSALFSVKIIRDSTGFRLMNTLTFNRAKKQTFELPPIRYYFDRDYPFDTLIAKQAHQKLIDFATRYQLSFLDEPMIYFFVYSRRSQINKDFGFLMHPFSVPSDIVADIGGTQIFANRMAFFGGPKAEGNIHEIIHILLRQITPTITLFEEGIATFYGGSMGKSYEVLRAELIRYLQAVPEDKLSAVDIFEFMDPNYNRTYTVFAVLVEEAKRRGGEEFVLEILKSGKSDTEYTFWELASYFFDTEQSEFITFLKTILNIDNK